MKMDKKKQNNARVRYIRALERFNKGIVSYLFKSENLSKEGYEKKVHNGLRLLQRAETVPLYKEHFRQMEDLTKRICDYAQNQTDIEEIKKDILYRANQLEKSVNFKKYKKPKHSPNSFEEWES